MHPESAIEVEVRLYDRLFSVTEPENVEEGQDFKMHLNTNSLKIVSAVAEPFVKETQIGQNVQFERNGYYAADSDSKAGKLVFNRTVPLKDTWTKLEKSNN